MFQQLLRRVKFHALKSPSSLLFAVIGIAGFCAPAIPVPAQLATVPKGRVVLSKLSPPIFPPLARAARVLGDVAIAVQVRQDGSVESAEVVRGHPLLKAAALDSARQSKFECHQCGTVATPYTVLYTFGYTTTNHCCQSPENSAVPQQTTESEAGITRDQNHITIVTEPLCICDPPADIVKVRSAKCLFLWHCSTRYGL
jgi:TonB family protein